MFIVALTVATGILAFALGWFLSALTGGGIPAASNRGEAFGFAALGLAVGLVLGLSTVPLIGAVVAAGFALVGTLLSIYLPKPAPPPAPPPPAPPPPVSTVAPLPIRVWLFPFAITTILGMLLGICLRVNDALYFRSESLRDRFASVGFTPPQIEGIMERLANSIKDTVSVKAVIGDAKDKAITGLQADESDVDWKDFWERMTRLGLSHDQVLKELKQIAPAPVRAQIKQLETQKKTADEILKTVRQDHPEIGG
jgi:hypothetical protein